MPHTLWCDAATAFCALWNAVDNIDDTNTLDLLRHDVHFGGDLISFGAAVEYKPAPFKGNTSLQKIPLRAIRGTFAGYYDHSGGEWSGSFLVYFEEALKLATAWYDIHLNRVREIV